jgi:hypothetical protein
MPELSLDLCLTPSDQVVMRELPGESVLLDLKSGSYFGLNEVGTRAWNLMMQGGSLQDVNESLREEFDAPSAVIQAELLRFAGELCAHGLCRVEGKDGR